ncbi:uncharacterized protein PHACADRAFT_203085 [Phanerochaete carnosa HHB-10118-sp]|uniref:Uncharacterized protein n=1 Tax=Phanerochaete carnosa (strain HHB-10118-sp) TaxID=650164 RepID=K5WDG7_PHACS|nr:uncharacterized protein PHACADRAFT_203085 [Phanerochaete carnosa HHB-10118-sp]EKM48222.1 hypothetical protein PHACADRAFT_203085 [Phanerochaete carnosa HHB-10118-sp]
MLPNVKLANLSVLCRLTVVVELADHQDDTEELSFLKDEPWSTLATFFVALRKRPDSVPPLEYIELQLELSRSIRNNDGDQIMAEVRRVFSHHQRFVYRADTELSRLIDDGLVESVKVQWRGGIQWKRTWTLQHHSCLNVPIVRAFPQLDKKDCLRLLHEVCECDG